MSASIRQKPIPARKVRTSADRQRYRQRSRPAPPLRRPLASNRRPVPRPAPDAARSTTRQGSALHRTTVRKPPEPAAAATPCRSHIAQGRHRPTPAKPPTRHKPNSVETSWSGPDAGRPAALATASQRGPAWVAERWAVAAVSAGQNQRCFVHRLAVVARWPQALPPGGSRG